MKKRSFTILFIFLGLIFFSLPASAETEKFLSDNEPASGYVLCKPGVQGDCLKLGPTAYQAQMKDMGFQLPFTPLDITQPDYELTYVPFLYGKVVTPNAPVYGSAEAAAKSKPVLYKMETGFSYISYTYTEVINDVRVYMIAPGVWMNANDVHRIGIPTFQGIEFIRTPRNPFGWIMQQTESKQTPGFEKQDYTGNIYNRYDILQVYGIQTVADIEWVMIKPGEWIEDRLIAKVIPSVAPPGNIDSDRWIDINLYEQTITVYDQNRMVFATVISSGVEPFWTRPGLFQIYQKLDTTPMTGTFEADRSDYYSLEDVPWTMYFDEARALHGAYWHTFYGYPRSHGCVNLSPGDAHWLFQWAQEGDWVYVHDPSGETPVDPTVYTAGGA